jgi:arabinose-5-phosphate isomerase
MITDGDLRRNMTDNILKKTVADIMTRDPITVDKNILSSELLLIMETKKITNIFVLDNKRQPIGVVHIHDIITKKVI